MNVVDELLDKIDIVELARKYTDLTPDHGGAYRGKCPIHHGHNESSFVVYPEGRYYCFSCHSFGNAIQLYSGITGEPFYQAVEKLCEEYEVSLNDKDFIKQKDTVGRNTRLAYRFHKQVGQVKDYLNKSRGLTDKTIEDFNLGYDYGGFMGSYTGLIIPIQDQYGRIVGFSKRRLDEGKPKYRNSPDDGTFFKGRILFNWHRAVKVARETGKLHLVEGYMDCMAAHQQGLACVAYMSSKPTKYQWELISKLNRQFKNITLILATDNPMTDKAGRLMLPRIREDALKYAAGVSICCPIYPDEVNHGL